MSADAIQPPLSSPAPTDPPYRFWRDRQLWLVLLLAALLLILRGIWITATESERVDDAYHMMGGMHFLQHSLSTNTAPNDSPLGEAVTSMPLFVISAMSAKQRPNSPSLFHGLIVSPTMVFVIIGIWKTLLFLPAVGLIFHWMRKIYGSCSAWLAAAVVCIEPNFAAHIPLPTLDILGVEGLLFGCYACWNDCHPTIRSLCLTGLLCAVALLLKHTTVMLPFVALVYAGLWWIVRPMLEGRRWTTGWSCLAACSDLRCWRRSSFSGRC